MVRRMISMNDEDVRALVEAVHREAAKHATPLPPIEPPTVHYTELPEAKAGEALYLEWNTYRREVARLLAEGHEGKFVLIKDETILGRFDTWEEARNAGLERFLLTPFLVREIRTREPYLRVRGVNFPCPN